MCILLSLQYEIGTVPIVTSTNKDHIEENIDIFTFELFDEDRQYLDTLNTGKRQMTMPGYESSAKYPFNDRVYKVDDDDEEADDWIMQSWFTLDILIIRLRGLAGIKKKHSESIQIASPVEYFATQFPNNFITIVDKSLYEI